MAGVSINVSQIFVRFPDPIGAAEFLASRVGGGDGTKRWVVARTPGPWLAVGSSENTPPPAMAQALSRGLEAQAIWYGLAGGALAYRMMRYALGRETDAVLEPAEIFGPDIPFPIPAYRDVETVLYARLRDAGLPADYLYLYFEEIGMEGGEAGKPDAAIVREGTVQPFAHRVPKRGSDAVRPLFDEYREEEKVVCERLRIHGSFDEARALQLLRTLETIGRRRPLPEGWKVRYLSDALRDPDLGPRLAAVHAKGGYTYELAAP